MIGSYLKRIYHANQKILISNFWKPLSTQTFSVAGHPTFGHTLKGDVILNNMSLLNKSLSKEMSSQLESFTLDHLFKKLQGKDVKYLKLSDIQFESQSIRQFNIFEVLAYCLFERMKTEIVTPILDKHKDIKQINDYAHFFFNRLEEYIEILKQFELSRLKNVTNINNLKQEYKKYLANCGMQLARRQIRRRFIQLCYFQQSPKSNLYKVCKQIERQFSLVAIKVTQLIIQQLKHDTFYNFFDILDDHLKKLPTVHESVKTQIKSMYNENILQAYYTPLWVTQSRFISNYGFQTIDNSYLIQTNTFIPTSITKLIFYYKNIFYSYFFLQGLKQMGKSMSAIQVAILCSYIQREHYLNIPNFDLKDIINNFKVCIVESFWRVFTKQKFTKIQELLKMLEKQAQIKQISSKTIQTLIKLFNQIRNSSNNINNQSAVHRIYVDQFSKYIGMLFSRDTHSENKSDKQKRKLSEKLMKNIQQFKKKIFCSSIAYQKSILQRQFQIYNDDYHKYQLQPYFKSQEAHRILATWMNSCFHLAKLINYQSINENEILLKQIPNKINNFITKLKESSQQTSNLSGQMIIIKGCAELLIQKMIKQPTIELKVQQLANIYHQAIVNIYSTLILDWITIVDQSQFKDSNGFNKKLLQRKIIISCLLCDQYSLKSYSTLYVNQMNPELPAFLLKDQDLINQLKEYASQIWEKVKEKCMIHSSTNKDEWLYKLFLLYKGQKQVQIGSSLGILFHSQINQLFKDKSKVQQNLLIKCLFAKLLPLDSEKNISIQRISLKNVKKQHVFGQIVIKSLENFNRDDKCKLFIFNLKAVFSTCDLLLLKLQSRQNTDTIFSSIIHIEVSVSQQKINKNIQERIQQYNQKGRYSFIFQKQMHLKNIILEKYQTLIITGHKKPQLENKINDMLKNKLKKELNSSKQLKNKQISVLESYHVFNINQINVTKIQQKQFEGCLEIVALYNIYCKDEISNQTNEQYYNIIKKMIKKNQFFFIFRTKQTRNNDNNWKQKFNSLQSKIKVLTQSQNKIFEFLYKKQILNQSVKTNQSNENQQLTNLPNIESNAELDSQKKSKQQQYKKPILTANESSNISEKNQKKK